MMGCTDGRYDAVLSQIDTLMEAHPDSALLRLDSIRSLKESWPKRLRMRYDLLEAKAQNKAFVDFTSDSIAKEFTSLPTLLPRSSPNTMTLMAQPTNA